MLMFCVNNLMHRQNNKNRAHTRTCKQMMSVYKAQLQLLICHSCGLHCAPLFLHRDFHSEKTLRLLCECEGQSVWIYTFVQDKLKL